MSVRQPIGIDIKQEGREYGLTSCDMLDLAQMAARGAKGDRLVDGLRSRSKASLPRVTARTASSRGRFAGPVSKAKTPSSSSVTTVTFAMPPRFWSPRTRPGARKRTQSA